MNTVDTPDNTAPKPPLALIAGPTASGKSDLAVILAEALAKRGQRGVVINADSSQVYADLTVLSARPTDEDQRGIEHRLYGAWDGAEVCSAAGWAERARAEVAALHGEGAVPILVGGAGLYLRTLLDGIAPVPPIDPAVREAVRSLPTPDSYAALQREDPDRAARLSPKDTARIARALEVVRSTGRTLADWQAESSGGIGANVSLHPLVLLPEREWLYERCDRRFAQMLGAGAIAEVELLLARQLDPALPVMRAIGVLEIAGLINGLYSVAECETMGAQATRNYAKRQYTWFRHQPPPAWPRADQNHYGMEAFFEALLRN